MASTSIPEILRQCEEHGLAPRYIESPKIPLEISSGTYEIYVVSDFHAASGVQKDGSYIGNENFYADGSFHRFLHYATEQARPRRILLVINGDFIDFLRIAEIPESAADFVHWQKMLAMIGIEKSVVELEASITRKERVYGLKTHDYKSVWKLIRAVTGHPTVFDALAEFLQQGNQLIVVKGNHDLEWYWLAVRNALRFVLGERIASRYPVPLEKALRKIVLPRVTFMDDAFIIDKELYIEHGHRYDKFTNVVGRPLWGKMKEELNIPFGSFFNRYLINKVELVYPFMDNVRPRGNILHMLMRDRFFLGIKVLFLYVPFMLKMIPKRYFHYMFKPLFGYAFALGLPLLIVLFLWGKKIWGLVSPEISAPSPADFAGFLEGYFSGFLRDGTLLFLSYLLARFVSYLQLDEPSSLLEPAKELLKKYPVCRYFTMGHTHNPEQCEENGRWYVNTSTWVPVIESSSAEIREDHTYALVRFSRGKGGRLKGRPLQRWNDDAGRIEPMIIVLRK